MKRITELRLSLLTPVLVIACAYCATMSGFQDESANRNTNSRPTNATGATKPPAHLRSKPRKNARSKTRETPEQLVSLLIISRPSNCKVYVDDELRGETDVSGELELKLRPGTYAIRLNKDGYLSSGGDVDVARGSDAQEIEFTLAVALTTINIVTDPAESEVYLDDVYKGASNSSGLLAIDRVSPGQPHVLRVRKTGYEQQSVPVTSYAGQISIKLISNTSRLKVVTDPPEAEIYLDGVYKGTSTSDGILVIEPVNPNETHSVRGQKSGFQQQTISLAPRVSETTIKLAADPIVILLQSVKHSVTEGRLGDAFVGYEKLSGSEPNHAELARLLESIIQNLQSRSIETLKQVGMSGLILAPQDIEEMSKLYGQARRWKSADETIDNFGKYWDLKDALAKADRTTSPDELEKQRRAARSFLLELGEHNLRNAYLILDMGWAWMKLNDRTAAQKQFTLALELKPDWAYPRFALGVLAMSAAEAESNKTAKALKYGEAIESLTKAISLKHDFARAYALRSISYAGLPKRYDEAIANGLQAVALDPQDAYAHLALGYANFQKGKSGYRAARDEFNRALTLGGQELDQAARNSIQQWLTQINKKLK